MDRFARRIALVLLVLAALGGAVLPWMACARDSSSPALAMTSQIAFSLGHLVCHQRPERSFFSCGRQWPVCGRCAGLYLGGAAGALIAFLLRRRLTGPGRRSANQATTQWRRIVVAAALPSVVLWLVEAAGVLDPGTAVRFGGALPLGIGVAGWLAAVASGDLR